MLPVMTEALAREIERAEIDYVTSRIRSIGERSGNPEGVDIRSFGKATAFYIKTMPWRTFNCVMGLGPEDTDKLDDILAFYRERERGFDLQINPAGASHELLKELAGRGLYQAAFHSVLYGLPKREMPVLPDGIRIVEVQDEQEFDRYAEIHCIASGMSAVHKHHFVSNNIGLLHRPGWKLFLGYYEDNPAAVGVMHLSGRIASCTLAATVPEFRGRGLQTALLHRRLYEAGRAGCELVTAQAAFGGTSQRNMERAGLRVAWTRAVWTTLD